MIVHDLTLLCKKRGERLLSLCKEARRTCHVCYRSTADCYREATFLFFPEKEASCKITLLPENPSKRIGEATD